MLTDLQRKKLPALFNLHDVDNDGLIGKQDFDQFARDLAQSRGLAADSNEEAELRARFATGWDSMRSAAGIGPDEQLSLDGWYAFWDTVLSTEGMYERVATPIGDFVFPLLDRNGSGSVAEEEYMMFYRAMNLDEETARSVFARFDQDGTGSLSVDEILAMLDQYFRSDDPEAPGNWFFGPYA